MTATNQAAAADMYRDAFIVANGMTSEQLDELFDAVAVRSSTRGLIGAFQAVTPDSFAAVIRDMVVADPEVALTLAGIADAFDLAIISMPMDSTPTSAGE